MRAVIQNLTRGPHDIQTAGGAVVLPAFGQIEADLDPAYAALLIAGRQVEITEAPVKRPRGRPRKNHG